MPRGKKQCPECKKYMGPRTKQCECGHEFVKRDKKAEVAAAKKAADEVRTAGGKSTEVAAAAVEAAAQVRTGKGVWNKPVPRPPKKKGAPPQVKKPFEGLTVDPVEVVGIRDREALKSFIDQLQKCYKHSDYSGGCYSAFFHHRHGTLRVEVWLHPDPRKAAKVKL